MHVAAGPGQKDLNDRYFDRRSRMRLAVIIPVFNDWASLSRLIGSLEIVHVSDETSFSLFVIDDGSNEKGDIRYPPDTPNRIHEIEIIQLVSNLGHQRAIAIGLVELCGRDNFDAVLIMDSDGEDRPDDIPRLIAQLAAHPGHVICAQRQRRPGRIMFLILYSFYKLIFYVLTGSRIDFGNFCLIPSDKIEALVSYSWVWNNFAGTLMRSRIPLIRMPSDRDKRYAGKSKMNFLSLVMHGLGTMAVYSDIIVVRLMLGALAVSAITLFGIVWVLFEKLFTDLAIPGWATSAVGLLVVILVQAVMVFATSAFSMINAQNTKVIVPKIDAQNYVKARRKVSHRASAGVAK
jgi:glycosyltransferase involved in cell wall biosynthesis